MAEQYLYLLANRDATAFKIGVSFQPIIRSARLPQEIDSEKSLQIPMIGGSASKVEKILHYLFQSQSFAMPRGDGYTEWFAIEALSDVLSFLEEQKIRLGIGPPERIPARTKTPPQVKLQDLTLDERRRLRKEIREQNYLRKRELATVNNRKAIECIRQLAEEWTAKSALIGTLIRDTNDRSTVYIYLKGTSDEISSWISPVMPTSMLIEGPRSSGIFSIFVSSYYDPDMGTAEISMPATLLVSDDETEEDVPGIDEFRATMTSYLSPAIGEQKILLLRLKEQIDNSRESFSENFWSHWRENSGGIL